MTEPSPSWAGYEDHPVTNSYPWLYRLSGAMKRRQLRGDSRLFEVCRSMGMLDIVVHRRLERDLARPVDFWHPVYLYPQDYDDLETYETLMLAQVARIVERFAHEAILIDCGADIGYVSAVMVGSSRWISELIAIEPNPQAFGVLQRNTNALPLKHITQLRAGAANFSGKGKLVSPPHDPSPHGRFVEPTDDTDGFDVIKIDSLGVDPDKVLVLKIDVEGAEPAVIEGALETLKNARDFVTVFEAHPLQVARSGVDPMTAVRLCQSARDCNAFISELPDVMLDLETPFFQQVPDDQVYNIICCT